MKRRSLWPPWPKLDLDRPASLSWRDVAVFAGLGAVYVAVMLHLLIFTADYPWGSGTDIATLQYPVRQYAFTWMRQGIFPLWNPFVFGGLPFAGGGAHPFLYPPLWLGAFLPTPTVLWLEILGHAWLGLVSFALLARYQGFCRVACLLGAASYATSGFFAGHLFAGHVDLLEAYAYLPLVLLSQEAALRYRGVAWSLLAGVTLALVGLIGNDQVLAWACMLWLYPLGSALLGRARPVSLRLAWRSPWLREAEPARNEDPLAPLARGLVAVALLAVVWLPRAEMSSAFLRRAGGVDTVPLTSWLTLLVPHIFERTNIAYAFTSWAAWEGQNYLGLVGLLCVFYALLTPWRRWLAYAIPALLFGLLAAGDATPLFGWLARLDPSLATLNVAGRFVGPMTLFLALLQVLGYHQIVHGNPTERKRQLFLAVAATGLLTCVWGVLFFASPEATWWSDALRAITTPEEFYRIQAGVQPEQTAGLLVVTGLRTGWSCMVLFFAILAIAYAQRRRLVWLQVLVLLDLTVFGAPYLQRVDPSTYLISGDVVGALQQVNLGVARFSGSPILCPFNGGMAYGLSNPGGYDLLSSKAYDRAAAQQFGAPPSTQVSRLQDVIPAPLWRIQGVAYYLLPANVTPEPAYAGMTVLGELTPDTQGLFDSYAFPRVFLVGTATRMADSEVLPLLLRDGERFRREVFLASDGPSTPEVGEVRRLALGPNEMRLEASGPGYLVTTDVWAPGWQAEVDGRSAPLLRANGGLHRAVWLEPGEHRVRLFFAPASLTRGRWVSGIALGLVLAVFLWGARGWRPRREKPQPPQRQGRKK